MTTLRLNPYLDFHISADTVQISSPYTGIRIALAPATGDALSFFDRPRTLSEALSHFSLEALDALRQSLILVPNSESNWTRFGVLNSKSSRGANPFAPLTSTAKDTPVVFGGGFAFPTAARHPFHGPQHIRRFLPPTIVDLGDVVVTPEDDTYTVGRKIAFVVSELLATGHKPFMLGGDHSVTYHAFKALAATRDVGLVILDAHTDRYAPSLPGCIPRGALTHANFVQRLLDEDAVKQVVLIGVRDDLLDAPPTAADPRVTVISATDAETLPGMVIAGVLDDSLPWYLSIDLDVLDPTYAPDVATPITGGLTLHVARQLVCAIAQQREVVAVDAVEVCASSEAYHRTAHAAAVLLSDVARVITAAAQAH